MASIHYTMDIALVTRDSSLKEQYQQYMANIDNPAIRYAVVDHVESVAQRWSLVGALTPASHSILLAKLYRDGRKFRDIAILGSISDIKAQVTHWLDQ